MIPPHFNGDCAQIDSAIAANAAPALIELADPLGRCDRAQFLLGANFFAGNYGNLFDFDVGFCE